MTDTDKATSPKSDKSDEKTPAEIWLRVAWCKSCGLCVDYCKPAAITMDGIYPATIDAAKCTRCRLCEAVCPDFAIEIDPVGTKGIRETGKLL